METERRGEVAWIRLARPERYNAYDAEMAAEITEAVHDAGDAGVIVITGTGKGFCAGGMLSPDAGLDEALMRRLYRSSIELFDAIRMSPRPVIAAVNGAAAGGGNELVVACDLAVAAESATFGQTGPRVGSAPVTGGTNLLAVQVGEKRAKEISFLCRRYTAAEALEIGLVNAVVPDGDLEAETTRWADELLQMSPRYLEIAKISSNVWWNATRDSFLTGVGMLAQAIGSDDMLEGMRAFSEKRPPRFRDLRTDD
ncbi:MAG TPA: enoyl-CoA hydratase-related protein [Acidimicrobiia bacterium]|nr:enoyl-CoA hydratase-related protein [Acidimicrobiia bacterium]